MIQEASKLQENLQELRLSSLIASQSRLLRYKKDVCLVYKANKKSIHSGKHKQGEIKFKITKVIILQQHWSPRRETDFLIERQGTKVFVKMPKCFYVGRVSEPEHVSGARAGRITAHSSWSCP